MNNVYEEGDQDGGEGGHEHAELAINKPKLAFQEWQEYQKAFARW